MSSKLRRSLSGVFGGKKQSVSTSRPLEPLQEVAEDWASYPGAPNDHAIYNEDLQQAMVASLREKNRSLEQERDAHAHKVSHLKQQLDVKTKELHSMQTSLRTLESRVNNDSLHFETALQQVVQQKDHTTQRQAQQIAELEEKLKEYQVSCVNLSEAQSRLQDKINELETENKTLLEPTNNLSFDVQREYVKCKRQVQALGQELQNDRKHFEDGKKALVESEARVSLVEQQKKSLEKELEALSRRMKVARTDADRRTMRKLEEQHRKHTTEMETATQLLEEKHRQQEAETEMAFQLLWGIPTPRLMLVHKILAQGFSVTQADSNNPNDDSFLKTLQPALLTNRLLDIQLDSQQAQSFSQNASAGELSLIVCDVCHLAKLAPQAQIRTRLHINEFAGTPQPTPCCSKSICSACYLDGISKSFFFDWWMVSSGRGGWVRCPSPGCNKHLPGLGHAAALVNLLRQLGDPDPDASQAVFDRILAFRAALMAIQPVPSDEVLRIAGALHSHLFSIKIMHWFFDNRFLNKEPDEMGRVRPFKTGKTRMIRLDIDGRSIEVPLFMRFLRRQKKAKECVICTDEYFDIDIGSVELWLDMCLGFHGDWMWNILHFPVRLGLECSHEIDFCSSCLDRHLASQLEQYGRSRCDQLSCPSTGCGRHLNYDEVRLYANRPTFTEYDRYLSLNALSKLPNFRWCLQSHCSSGQIYGDDGGPEDPHIQCEACGFQMCYTHSMPWHQEQTCEQYDSIRQHGDPEFQGTREWIAQNTKPCPGCQENIQKGEYCFHMTCSMCRSEFCWECLADWRLISTASGHNPNAHGEGCPFRTNGVTPTQIAGTSFQQAMAQRAR